MRFGQRFNLKDIQRRRFQLPAIERGQQILFHHLRTARDVKEESAVRQLM